MKTRLLISAMLLCAGASCTRTVYTPVVSTASDSLYSASIWRDTLYLLDSVRVEVRGDSVKEARTRTLYRTVTRIDTVRETSTDTIRITLPPESKKETPRVGVSPLSLPWHQYYASVYSVVSQKVDSRLLALFNLVFGPD